MTDHDAHLPEIADGDPAAFERWLAGCEPRLRASLRPFATHADVEAVLQESLLRLWQVAPRHRPDGRPESLLRLAIRIARNLAIDEIRRARLAPVHVPAPEEVLAAQVDSGPGGEPDPLLRRAIAECRERLPRKPASALYARLEAGGGDADAALALRLGMKLNTFLQNVTRARKLLAECLERRGVDLAELWR